MRAGGRRNVVWGTALAAVVAIGACAAPRPAASQDAGDGAARAVLMDAAGNEIGQVALRETAGHGVLMEVRLSRIQPGTYAIHIHETGVCASPSFQSAGGHYAPHGRAHGVLHPDGMHGGDLLNVRVPAGGALRTERLAAHVTLEAGEGHTLFDDDGSAIVVHAGVDDYRSQPSGDAGARALCGVVVRAEP